LNNGKLHLIIKGVLKVSGISVILRVDLLIYSIVMNFIMYFYLNFQKIKENYGTKLFKRIILSIIIITTIEVLTWCVGEIGNSAQIPIHYWSNALFLSLIALPEALSFAYLDFKIFGSEERSKKRLFLYLIPTYMNIGFVIYNHFYRGVLFYIASNNQYYRGLFYKISMLGAYIFLIIAVVYFYRYKNMISGRITQAFIGFCFIPVIGSFLQMISYGTTFGMPSYTLAVFLAFMLVERDELLRDPLTNLYSRAHFENRLRFKLKSRDPFTIIMADLDEFKIINDTYGHTVGDQVLKKVSELLQSLLNFEDLVYRYGGDEFVILIENTEDIGEGVIEKIDKCLDFFNINNLNYNIELSCGYLYIEEPEKWHMMEIVNNVDKKMYQSKHKTKNHKKIILP